MPLSAKVDTDTETQLTAHSSQLSSAGLPSGQECGSGPNGCWVVCPSQVCRLKANSIYPPNIRKLIRLAAHTRPSYLQPITTVY